MDSAALLFGVLPRLWKVILWNPLAFDSVGGRVQMGFVSSH
ncbi:hypothetical protein Hdeb2414_s0015g00444041 [Helianthus debilis subsp. tardiflorus]